MVTTTKVPVPQDLKDAAKKAASELQNGAAKPEKAKKPKVAYKEVFPTADAAVEEAKSRTKGPRRVFTTTWNGKTFHVVAHNEGRAAGVAYIQHGGKVEEIGRAARATKAMSMDAILQVLNALPEDQRKAVLEQYTAMKK